MKMLAPFQLNENAYVEIRWRLNLGEVGLDLPLTRPTKLQVHNRGY